MRNRPLDFSDDLRIHGGPEGFEPTLPHLEAGDTDRFVELAEATVADEVHRAANKQMIHGGRQLGFNRFARVPVSDEKTCDFCTMLASRGFAYFTEETAGMYTKYHPTCRCKVMAGGRGKNTVAGYDPEEQKRYYELNKKLEGEGYSRAQRRKALEGVPLDELGEPNSGNLGRPKKKDKALAASRVYLNRSTELFSLMSKVSPIPGFEDFGLHGDENGRRFLYTDADDKKVTIVTPRELAEFIRNDPSWNGGPIRLLVCRSGMLPDGAAQQLANILDVDVMGATTNIYINMNGEMALTDDEDDVEHIYYGEMKNTGEWIVFKPERRKNGSK